jgi:peptidoglycan/LPS O-acetylase OafA/YrhL
MKDIGLVTTYNVSAGVTPSEASLDREAAVLTPVSPPSRAFRADIEGLRAVAVTLVLLFHASVPHFAGGFAGVDVFFVISGFLIIGGLRREVHADGTVRLVRFFAGRARRLLPSAGVVLIFVGLASWALLPPLQVVPIETDIVDASLYLVNWHFIAEQTNYLQQGADPSPLLHFWSLAVEEQFYVICPILFLIIAKLSRKPAARTTLSVAALVLVAASSFIASLAWSTSDKPLAYMGSPSRAWQFAVGGLCAFLPTAIEDKATTGTGKALRLFAGIAGFSALGYSSFFFAATTVYPGWAAVVPTLGTAAIIVAGSGQWTPGSPASLHGVGRWLSWASVRWIGRLSYPLYLWHWALLVIVVDRVGDVAWQVRLSIELLAVAPALVTLRFIERPIRFSRVVRHSPSHGLAVGLTAMTLPLIVALVGGTAVITQVGGATPPAPASVALQAKVAALAGDPFGGRGQAQGGPVNPSLLAAPKDKPRLPTDCRPSQAGSVACTLNASARGGKIMLVGDASVVQWVPAVLTVAEDHNWAVVLAYDKSCAVGGGVQSGHSTGDALCPSTWGTTAAGALGAGGVKLVFTSDQGKSGAPGVGYTNTLQELMSKAPVSVPLVFLRPPPSARSDVLECLARHLNDWSACGTPRKVAEAQDLDLASIPRGLGSEHLADFTDLICPASYSICPPARNGTLLYGDDGDLTATASGLLGFTLEALLERDGIVELHVGVAGAMRTGGSVTPSLARAADDWPMGPDCLVHTAAASSAPCVYGDILSKVTVVLFGDSHAYQWVPAFEIIAQQEGWRLEVYAKEGCPVADLKVESPSGAGVYSQCTAWRARTLNAMRTGPKPALIVLGTLNRYTSDSGTLLGAWSDSLTQLESIGSTIVYIRDTPWSVQPVPTCLSANLSDWARCNFSKDAVPADPVADRLRLGWYPRVRVVDIDALLCPQQKCSAVFNGIVGYIDQGHLTQTFSSALAPLLTEEIQSVPGDWQGVFVGRDLDK